MRTLVSFAVCFLSVAAHSQDVAIHFETGNTLAANLNSDKVLREGGSSRVCIRGYRFAYEPSVWCRQG